MRGYDRTKELRADMQNLTEATPAKSSVLTDCSKGSIVAHWRAAREYKRINRMEDTGDDESLPLYVHEFIRFTENEEYELKLQMDREKEDASH
jgi:hypothetical protein